MQVTLLSLWFSGFAVKQDSEIAPRRRGGRRVSEFLNKKFSDLCELYGEYFFIENPE
jgi:hypothetical protein